MGFFSNYIHKNKGGVTGKEKSLLWEITGKDLQAPSYYYGTMHLMCAEDVELSNRLLKIIEQVLQIYLEVDMTNANQIFGDILEKRETDKVTLRSVLSLEEYEKVKNFFEVYQPALSFSMLEKQPPLMITSSLYELLLPCEIKNGVELKILEEANKKDKPLFGLETIEFQAAIFDAIPFKEQANDLLRTINNLESNRTLLYDMIDAYKQQDIEKLFSLSASDKSIAGNHLEMLLFERNRNWVSRFKEIAENTSTLFAVGAGHLGGEMGVLNLLRQQGYMVTPIV